MRYLGSTTPEKPAMNVLFVTADQWRAECLSALGHPCLRTPNLDRLAAGGTLFSRHFAQATPCGPSRASIHTGMYAMNHRSVTNGTPLDAPTPTLRRRRGRPVTGRRCSAMPT
jgi:arylsulfatase A-like enzyme